jgi:hypothetical protein
MNYDHSDFVRIRHVFINADEGVLISLLNLRGEFRRKIERVSIEIY